MQFTRNLLLATALDLLGTSSAAQVIHHVDVSLTTGANDGSSWSNARQGPLGLQAAPLAATAGDRIFVAQGTYIADASSRTTSFDLKVGVELYGSFLGGESSPSERPPFGLTPTVLSGDLAGNDAANQLGDNSVRIVDASDTDATAVLDGFEFRAGVGDGAGFWEDRGAAIYCRNGAGPTVRNCRFIGNETISFGGAVAVINSAPSFTNCTFEDNETAALGGAVFLNMAGGTRVDRCTFLGNTASGGGGLSSNDSVGVLISNSLFVGNHSDGSAGGGAIYSAGGPLMEVRGCTIVGNTSLVHTAGGLRAQGGSVMASNTILWGNTGSGTSVSAHQTSGGWLTNCIVEGGFVGVGSGNSALDPLFVDLAAGDYRLTANSPAIDAGENSLTIPGTNLDLGGAPRFVDNPAAPDTGVGIAPIIDIGAFEFFEPSFERFCLGDGSGAACPCGNNSAAGHAGGCLHANGDGGILDAAGTPSFTSDTLHFGLSSGVPLAYCVLLSGDNRLPLTGNIGHGIPSFDGLRCADGSVRMHGGRVLDTDGRTTGWGPGTIVQQGSFAVGQTRHFFALYRTLSSQTCNTGVNSTNGVSVTFVN